MTAAIVIEDYRAAWPGEFAALGRSLRGALGDVAQRIDHIGSTAVPGLAAKDIADVQVTVAELDDPGVARAFDLVGATPTSITADHAPPGSDLDPVELHKRLYVLEPPARRANVHVRQAGRFNQRYPLVCRDFLAAHPDAAAAYAEIKRQLAKHFPDDAEAYYDIKDPTFDVIMSVAREWAARTGWEAPPSDA